MAFRRNLAIRAKHYTQQQFSLPLSYIRHENDDRSKVEAPKIRTFSQGSFVGRNCKNVLGFGGIRRNPQIPSLSLNGSVSARHMSSSSEDSAKVLEEISGYVLGLSEVAAAAEDLFFPIAVLHYLIGGIHVFTNLNWWSSIAVTTLLIQYIATPLMIKRPREEVEEMLQFGLYKQDPINMAWFDKDIGDEIIILDESTSSKSISSLDWFAGNRIFFTQKNELSPDFVK